MEKEEPRQRRRNDMGVSHKRGGRGGTGNHLSCHLLLALPFPGLELRGSLAHFESLPTSQPSLARMSNDLKD